MKASSELALSFNEHQEITGGIRQVVSDFELMQLQPSAMSGNTSLIPLDPSKVPRSLDGYLDGKNKFSYEFRLLPDSAPEASLKILDVDPRRNWRLVLNGDNKTWNLLNANTGQNKDLVPHAQIVAMLGSSARINSRMFSEQTEYTDESIVQTLAAALPLSEQARSYTAQTHYISNNMISPITANLLLAKKQRALNIGLLLEDTLNLDDKKVESLARRQYVYMLNMQSNQMRSVKARVSIEDEGLEIGTLRNLVKNDQLTGNDAAERFRKALTMLKRGSLPDFLAVS